MHKRKLTMKGNYPPNSIIALYKSSVRLDMVRPTTVNATGEKYVPLKSSGNEKI